MWTANLWKGCSWASQKYPNSNGIWKGGLWRGQQQLDELPDLMVMLVDPNDGLALQAPTGEAWVQWITKAVLVDPNDGHALQTPTGEAWVQWVTMDNGDEQ